jgi:hypothetical protein
MDDKETDLKNPFLPVIFSSTAALLVALALAMALA